MPFPRLTGILLHPISLPSRGGIGDLGPCAYEFVEFLSRAKQGLWQVLPLGPPANGNSPYSSLSAFAGNPLLVSLERLADHGWIAPARLQDLPAPSNMIDYGKVRGIKLPLLAEAANNFLSRTSGGKQERFQGFAAQNKWWLEDFVLFDALRERYRKDLWTRWPADLARRVPEALQKARGELAAEMAIGRVIQFFFYEQWGALRASCAAKSVRIVGDVAIFVDYDSADVWANRHLFRLKDNLEPEVVSGVPPDVFSATGQRWGNPLYNWQAMKAQGYEWWVARLRWATYTCDFIRLDHFRGFEQFWEIPASEPTAIHGKWVDGPKDDLFNKLREALGGLPFFAEDLGIITKQVDALRERQHIPGMAVLQFGFGDPGAHIYLPHKLTADRVVYTGTHDNDTTRGWWQKSATEHEQRAVEALVGRCEDGVNWALMRAAQGSVANFSIAPLQDVLGLGSAARLNVPSRSEGNYLWRFRRGDVTAEHERKLALLAETTDRVPPPLPQLANQDFLA